MITIMIDAQWGSCGKGKLSGWLAANNKYDYFAASYTPAAGHTLVLKGESHVLKMLPCSVVVRPDIPVIICRDAVVNASLLIKEAAKYNAKVKLHPLTALLDDQDADKAAVTGRKLAGTMQGTGHALARKLLRHDYTIACQREWPGNIEVGEVDVAGKNVLFEYSQGFDLSLNYGAYPYCTSRDVTVGAAINSLGISHREPLKVIGVCRSFPIRVGNVEGGWSGPCHADQQETTWEAIGQKPELTTVTKRVRRVFTFSWDQMKRFKAVCAPDELFFNFAQYIDPSIAGVKGGIQELFRFENTKVGDFIDDLSDEVAVVRYIGTGADQDDMIVI